MNSVDLYGRVRRACHVEGMSPRAAARHLGSDRKTMAKILTHAVSPECWRQILPGAIRRSAIDPPSTMKGAPRNARSR